VLKLELIRRLNAVKTVVIFIELPLIEDF